MKYVVDIIENAQIVLHVPEDVHYADCQLIENILRRDFKYQRYFDVYLLKKNDDSDDNNGDLKVRLFRLHYYLKKENIPHRLSVIADPCSVDETVKLSYFFWFDSEGVKKVFNYTPYIPTERDFIKDEFMRKLHEAGNRSLNYVHALRDYKTHSSDSMARNSKPSQIDLRHLHLSKQLLST